MNNTTPEIVALCMSILCAATLIPTGISCTKILKKGEYDLADSPLIQAGQVLGLFFGTVAVAGAGFSAYKLHEEIHAVYHQKQHTVYVTGVCSKRPSAAVEAIDTTDNKRKFVFCGPYEATLIERGDTIVVKSIYRNGKHVEGKDSLVANLTRDKLITNMIQQNQSNQH